MKKLFENKTAIVSGGLGDIGRAIAIAFAQEGANIAICGTRQEAVAQEFLLHLNGYGVKSVYHEVNVSDAKAVESWFDEVCDRLGVPSFIIPNAATVTQADVLNISAQQWAGEINVNLNGAFYMAQTGAHRMLAKKMEGHIVFIGSWAAHAVHTSIPAYCVAKAGLRMLCQCMALEFASEGIKVNEVAPGYVDAGLSKKVWEKNAVARKEAVEKVPVKDLISPEEVAWQVLNLCHPNNKNITGSSILIDGGLSLQTK